MRQYRFPPGPHVQPVVSLGLWEFKGCPHKDSLCDVCNQVLTLVNNLQLFTYKDPHSIQVPEIYQVEFVRGVTMGTLNIMSCTTYKNVLHTMLTKIEEIFNSNRTCRLIWVPWEHQPKVIELRDKYELFHTELTRFRGIVFPQSMDSVDEPDIGLLPW